MKSGRNFKSYISMLFSGIYLFAFLFAANIHEHDSGYFYKDFHFKNSSSKIDKQNSVNNADPCLSCHFAATSALLPSNVEISAGKIIFNSVVYSNFKYQITQNSYFYNFLRGPPSFI